MLQYSARNTSTEVRMCNVPCCIQVMHEGALAYYNKFLRKRQVRLMSRTVCQDCYMILNTTSCVVQHAIRASTKNSYQAANKDQFGSMYLNMSAFMRKNKIDPDFGAGSDPETDHVPDRV